MYYHANDYLEGVEDVYDIAACLWYFLPVKGQLTCRSWHSLKCCWERVSEWLNKLAFCLSAVADMK